MTKLEELKQKRTALMAEMQAEYKVFFKEASAEIFAKYPAIKTFRWEQYTPYYSDGDECVFGVRSDPTINGIDLYESCEERSKLPDSAFDEIRTFLDSFELDMMKQMFGDHVRIIVSPDEVKIETCEHD